MQTYKCKVSIIDVELNIIVLYPERSKYLRWKVPTVESLIQQQNLKINNSFDIFQLDCASEIREAHQFILEETEVEIRKATAAIWKSAEEGVKTEYHKLNMEYKKAYEERYLIPCFHQSNIQLNELMNFVRADILDRNDIKTGQDLESKESKLCDVDILDRNDIKTGQDLESKENKLCDVDILDRNDIKTEQDWKSKESKLCDVDILDRNDIKTEQDLESKESKLFDFYPCVANSYTRYTEEYLERNQQTDYPHFYQGGYAAKHYGPFYGIGEIDRNEEKNLESNQQTDKELKKNYLINILSYCKPRSIVISKKVNEFLEFLERSNDLINVKKAKKKIADLGLSRNRILTGRYLFKQHDLRQTYYQGGNLQSHFHFNEVFSIEYIFLKGLPYKDYNIAKRKGKLSRKRTMNRIRNLPPQILFFSTKNFKENQKQKFA
ncbi:9866_t:CDS:2 [Funneliformis caledonium]|uniref:9866_t:CDS:1 n=1 Tax=Funneliformis caledonium TaxID=1117310 RepID=A0A9N9BVY2_9GLOM|nr:9866_t:CDS:2 [Funneliformis caledonium]